MTRLIIHKINHQKKYVASACWDKYSQSQHQSTTHASTHLGQLGPSK